MKKLENHTFVIFGATGDLSKRKLIPGLFDLFIREFLPEKFLIIGCGRKNISNQNFVNYSLRKNKHLINIKYIGMKSKIREFEKYLRYFKIDPNNEGDFIKLKSFLYNHYKQNRIKNKNIIFYFSTPPSAFRNIIKNISSIGLNKEQDGWKRLIIEKPFGNNLKSAKSLNSILNKNFKEKQLYRIDHYLGKETVQNLLVIRFSNPIFESTWDNKNIKRIEITAAGKIGIENRGEYYEETGALKDMIQNHLLELLTLTTMENPTKIDSDSIRNEKLKVLKCLKLTNDKFENKIVLGQYTESFVRNKKQKSYRNEKMVNKNSKTETFVALKTFINNKRWKNVPIFLRTGKKLPTKVTEIVIHFKNNKNIFNNFSNKSSNLLVIRIQPNEGILLKFDIKKPGEGFKVINENLDFYYSDLSKEKLMNSYERLLIDVINGDTMLFSRGDCVEEAWKYIDKLSNEIKRNDKIKVYGYKCGTWGPENSNNLFEKGDDWRYPCKNLVNDGGFCEL